VKDTTFKRGGGARNTFSPVLKVPRQCPLVLLVERESEDLDRKKEVEPGFYCVSSKLMFISHRKGCIIVKF
jgi:hypothetical protein